MAIKLGIIPAAGQGLRTTYLGKMLPKCLLPVYDRPILHYIIHNMIDAGVTDIRVVTHHKEDMVADYIDTLVIPDDVGISIVHQLVLNGDGNAVKCALDGNDKLFFVVLGDDISCPNPLIPMATILKKKKAMAVEGIIAEPSWEKLSNACSVDILDERITNIVEKPKDKADLSWIRGCGVYAFHPDAWKNPPITKDGYLWISDIIKQHIYSSSIYSCILNNNININTPDDLLEASLFFQQIRGKGV